jgi:DNA-binding protein H-NS
MTESEITTPVLKLVARFRLLGPSAALGLACIDVLRYAALPDPFRGDIDDTQFLGVMPMAKANLASMSVEALLKLRDDIGRVLNKKAGQLQSQLAALGDGAWSGTTDKRASRMKGRKVAPKYRNPKNPSETWAGRGAMPRWMAAEIKKGRKRDYFAIDKAAKKAKRKAVKRSPRKRKVVESAEATSAA